MKKPAIHSYTSNPALQTVKADWKGTPLDEKGLFINQEFPARINYWDVLRFMLQKNPQRAIKKTDTWRIDVLKDDTWLNDSEDTIVWLGHASFYLRLSGVRILIDPVLGKPPLIRRFSELPADPRKLVNIDYILVSHAHYDHCDKNSLRLLSTQNPMARVCCGLELDKLIGQWMDNLIQPAGWYQQYAWGDDDVRITFLPSRHWANRGLSDINTTLWGGFMIQAGAKCIYYGGDSGFGAHFGEIGATFPDIDVALIGAGAYSPAWFMAQNHQDPYHAVEAFYATGAKTFIPFHYGTFDSADEPMGEPEQILGKLRDEGKIRHTLKILKLGEVHRP